MQPVDVLCNDTSVGTTSTEVRQCIVAQVRFSIQVFCFVMRRQPKLVPPVQRVGQELLASRVGRDKIRPDGVCTSTVGWNSTVHGKTGTSDKQNALGGFKECGKAFHHSRIDTVLFGGKRVEKGLEEAGKATSRLAPASKHKADEYTLTCWRNLILVQVVY